MDLVAAASDTKVSLSLFLTGTGDNGPIEHGKFPNRTHARRITTSDLTQALDGYDGERNHDRSGTLCYVCGPSHMTDEFVTFLIQQSGMAEERVLCEKWW